MIEEVPSSIRNVQKLKRLLMHDCKKLQVIPININLASLEEVDMSDCSQLASFPDISSNIRELQLARTMIEEVPSSIRNLHKLKRLLMHDSKKLRVIPININLASLEEVNMSDCSQLASFPDISSNIRELQLARTLIEEVPSSIRNLNKLKRLLMHDCKNLRVIPTNIKLASLEEVDMSGCSQLASFLNISSNIKVLELERSNLEKLWGGIEPLPNLKSINLRSSFELKEIPNLLKATNLETLNLEYCLSLVELPSSIRNLHKLKRLLMHDCKNLRVIPTNINLASLEEVDMSYCSQSASFPDISSNIRVLRLTSTQIKEIPSSLRNLHKLKKLIMYDCKKLRVIPTNINLPSLEVVYMNYCSQLESFPDISSNIKELNIEGSKIKDVPPSVVSWSHLEWLDIGSTSVERLTHVPPSVRVLHANGCVSLKRVCCSFPNETRRLSFYHCIQLDEESRRGIIQQSIQGEILLPGKEIPTEFTHKATGNSISIPLGPRGEGTFSATSRFKACILLSPIEKCQSLAISYRLRSKGDGTIHSFSRTAWLSDMPSLSEHLFIFSGDLFPQQNRCHEVDGTSEITFEFSCQGKHGIVVSCDDKIIECGVEIMMEEAEGSSSSQVENFETQSGRSQVDTFETESSSSKLGVAEAKWTTLKLGVAEVEATTTTTQMDTERKTKKQKVSR